MVGSNTLTLNEATMIEAIQEYLDKRDAGGQADRVSSIKSTGGISNTFEVNLREREDPNP